MRNSKLIRCISMVLMAILLLSQASCSLMKTEEANQKTQVKIEPMEPEESLALSFDVIGGKDVMPVASFYGPYRAAFSVNGNSLPDYFTDEFMKEVAASGVNLISYTEHDTSGKDGQILMDLGQNNGIGIFINDGSILNMRGQNAQLDINVITEKMSKYRNHPAFAGMYVVDEPGGKDYWTKGEGSNMEDYASLSNLLREECGVETYTNLICINTKGQTEQYESYLKEYCETMNPSVMLFDYYVWDKGASRSIFLYNLALTRKYAIEYKLPLWNFIGCGSYWGDTTLEYEVLPSEGQFDWSINASLAYGAQGINYFTLIQPFYFATTTDPQYLDAEKNGMFGLWGNKNRWYYYAQDISKQITAIDGVLMNSVNKGVIVSGMEAINDTADSPDVLMTGTSWRELANVSGDALVGCFNYQGKTALYVVNYDAEYAQDIKLDFYDNYKMQVTQAGETEYVDTSTLTLKMKAGDGVLIVIQ